MEKESFSKLESLNCEMEDLKDMLSLMIEDCFVFNVTSLNEYEVREKYSTAQVMTNAIFKLLHYSIEDSNNFINKVYEQKKENKKLQESR